MTRTSTLAALKPAACAFVGAAAAAAHASRHAVECLIAPV